MKKRIQVAVVFWMIVVCSAFPAWQIAAQDNPVVTPTDELIVLPPDATLEPTPVPVPTPEPTPAPEQPPVVSDPNQLSHIIAVAIAFVLYCAGLAAGVQVTVNQLKPMFLQPIKEGLKLSDDQYLAVIYVARTAITALAYFFIWGGVGATRMIVTSLPAIIPDAGVAVGTILLVVLGEEILHPLIERLYLLRDTAKLLADLQIAEESRTSYKATVVSNHSALVG